MRPHDRDVTDSAVGSIFGRSHFTEMVMSID
ncbi:hypothetical protein O971_13230 [Mycobacterium avium subsp. hominissuis 10-4249]|nr:hypothetical protein O971_13230 [Mycobacterium avium subsp. hominissuis 10-4249]